jgi:hypothetical protein
VRNCCHIDIQSFPIDCLDQAIQAQTVSVCTILMQKQLYVRKFLFALLRRQVVVLGRRVLAEERLVVVLGVVFVSLDMLFVAQRILQYRN